MNRINMTDVLQKSKGDRGQQSNRKRGAANETNAKYGKAMAHM